MPWIPLLSEASTVRDLRERTGELIRDAEAGKLSIVTKHGQPVFVAVPFDEVLVREGIAVALAVKLFDEEHVSLGKAARLAGMNRSMNASHNSWAAVGPIERSGIGRSLPDTAALCPAYIA